MENLKFSDQQIINGIRNNENIIVQFVYKDYLPVINRYVMNNSGDESSSLDIFQEAMIIIFKKLRKDNLYLSCSFKTYFVAICKKLWLNYLRNSSRNIIKYYDNFEEKIPFEPYYNLPELSDFSKIFFKHFNNLSQKSQEVLMNHFKQIPPEVVAIRLGFKNKEYAISRKYKCLKRLVINIKNDPELMNINVEDERFEIF